jgi:PAS domain S-box-containing protein
MNIIECRAKRNREIENMARIDNKSANKGSAEDPVDKNDIRSDKKPVTYSQVKEQLKQTVERTEHDNLSDDTAEIAIEVIEEDIPASQPMKRAFIAEHLFRKTIEDAIPSGIAAIDHTGRQIYVNRTFCEMLGWDEKELLGASFPYVYWAAEDVQRNQDSYLSLQAGDIPPNGLELLFVRKSGDKFWGWVLGSPLYNSDGEPAGHLFSIVDINTKKEAEDALKQFSAQLVDARERERQLISQDLHDSIGGRLAGIKYGLETIIRTLSANSGKLADPLNNLLQVVKSAIEETRRISKNLHPSVLDDLGLKAALRDLVREFRIIYPAIAVNCSLDIDDYRLSGQLNILIYRVCQEALTNIGKHSRANQVVLQLFLSEEKAVLTIRDNGIGIQSAPPTGQLADGLRFGLLNMRERIELSGGRLEVHSEIGRGVHLHAVWPISGSTAD